MNNIEEDSKKIIDLMKKASIEEKANVKLDSLTCKTFLEYIERLKEERELVGLQVKNLRDGKIGIVLHEWENGSVAVLESIVPRVINTHDSWKTLEIITDNVEQIKTKSDSEQSVELQDKANKYDSLVEKIKEKIEELPLTIVGGRRNSKVLNYGIKLGRKQALQELLDTEKE